MFVQGWRQVLSSEEVNFFAKSGKSRVFSSFFNFFLVFPHCFQAFGPFQILVLANEHGVQVMVDFYSKITMLRP
jgi:hypothetical protein